MKQKFTLIGLLLLVATIGCAQKEELHKVAALHNSKYQTNGNILKITKTDSNSVFKFLEDSYSVSVLHSSETIKYYSDEKHYEVKLVKDKYNRLFAYSYREEMCFDGDADHEDTIWNLVESIEDADAFVNKKIQFGEK